MEYNRRDKHAASIQANAAQLYDALAHVAMQYTICADRNTAGNITQDVALTTLRSTIWPALAAAQSSPNNVVEPPVGLTYNHDDGPDNTPARSHPVGEVWKNGNLWYVQFPHMRDGYRTKKVAAHYAKLAKMLESTRGDLPNAKQMLGGDK